MVSKRNRTSSLTEYLNSIGIDINIGKNKARGNKGLFKVAGNKFRIDISKNLTEDASIRTLVHEFAHFLHYKNDKSLKSLEFIFGANWEEYSDELINLTVDLIPKASISPIFEQKNKIKLEIKTISNAIKSNRPDFLSSKPYKQIEQKILKLGYKSLLKYDKVRYLTFTGIKNLSIDTINIDSELKLYLQLKSKQRIQKRINSKISSLNKYYNSPTVLWARALEYCIFEPEKTLKIAPNIFRLIDKKIASNELEELASVVNIVKSLY